MIFKETGNYQIHRLRVIHIYEADFNLLLAVKWRQLLQSADLLGLINEGLFGGRPGCEAQSLTFLEELKYDISFMTRRTLFNFDNDATSCYDRIIVALASLLNRKYGLHRKVVTVHASTLQQARFHLRTINGISDQFYSHSIQFPVYGSGQGSGNSPGIWLFISSTLCDVHNSISHGATFTTPDGTEQVSISMVGFVDDSTGTYNNFQPQTELSFETMMSHMQTDAQAWNDLLWCSGGKLELPKCSYHVLRFKFESNGAPSPNLTTPEIPLLIKDSETGSLIPIPPKQANDPHKTLGHWKAPCEKNNKTQLKYLEAKAKQTTALIATGSFSRYGTQLAYSGVYISSLKYVLPQCYFEHKHLSKAESKTASIILAKLGFNRHTPLAIRYAPKTLAGCGMIPWWILQSEGQLSLFIKHWRTDTMISKTLRIATAWLQWQSGMSESVLIDTATPLPHIEARWLQSLRYGLNKASFRIHLHRQYTIPPEREGDIHIMQWAIASKRFTDKHLKVLNYCRMYLHVTTISELFSIYLPKILPHMYTCTRPSWFNTKQFMPLQQRPSSYQIRKIWKPFCDIWIQQVDSHEFQLGTTTGRATQCRPYRQTYQDFTEPNHTIYHWINDSFWAMTTTLNPITAPTLRHVVAHQPTIWRPHHRAHPISITPVTDITTNPTYQVNLIPIPQQTTPETTNDSNSPTPRHVGDHLPRAPAPAIPPTPSIFRAQCPSPEFQQHISIAPLWKTSTLQNVTLALNSDNMMARITACHTNRQNLIAIVDSSFQDENASYGWILYLPNGEAIAENHGPNQGQPSGPRALAWGLLSASIFLTQFMEFLHMNHTTFPHVTILSKNTKHINYLLGRPTYPTLFCNATLANNWDIMEQTHQLRTQSQMVFNWKTVPDYRQEHMQQNPPTFNLDQSLADTRDKAKAYLQIDKTQYTFSPFLPSSRCQVYSLTSTINQQYNENYREAATTPPLRKYLQEKNNWTDEQSSFVQWDWLRTAVRTYQGTSRNHLTKLIYNQLPTPARKAKAGGQHWTDPTCPHCQLSPETFEHLLRCDDQDAITFRMQLPKSILALCKKSRIPSEFQKFLLSSIESWLGQHLIEPLQTSSDQIKRLHESQGKIGWTNFTRGFFSRQWSDLLITEINPEYPMRISPSAFFPKLIRILWSAQTTFWSSYQER